MADETTTTTTATEPAAATPAAPAQASTETQSAEQTAQSNILAEATAKTAEQAATETKTEETKTEEKKPELRAPEEYAEFTKPPGVELDETAMSEFKSFAKEQDLTQEQAQKLLEFGSEKIKAQLEGPVKVWNEMQEKWKAEVKADPEIGGTKYEESVKNASLVFQPGEANPFVKTADEAKALREALNTTGAGNNPAMVKLFVKMGQLLSEPGSLTGKPVSTDRQGALLDKFYPSMTEAGQK